MRMASTRESETFEQTVDRQEQNRMRMAIMRESETFEETVHKQEQNRMHMASMSLKPLSKLCRGKSEIECTKQA